MGTSTAIGVTTSAVSQLLDGTVEGSSSSHAGGASLSLGLVAFLGLLL